MQFLLPLTFLLFRVFSSAEQLRELIDDESALIALMRRVDVRSEIDVAMETLRTECEDTARELVGC